MARTLHPAAWTGGSEMRRAMLWLSILSGCMTPSDEQGARPRLAQGKKGGPKGGPGDSATCAIDDARATRFQQAATQWSQSLPLPHSAVRVLGYARDQQPVSPGSTQYPAVDKLFDGDISTAGWIYYLSNSEHELHLELATVQSLAAVKLRVGDSHNTSSDQGRDQLSTVSAGPRLPAGPTEQLPTPNGRIYTFEAPANPAREVRITLTGSRLVIGEIYLEARLGLQTTIPSLLARDVPAALGLAVRWPFPVPNASLTARFAGSATSFSVTPDWRWTPLSADVGTHTMTVDVASQMLDFSASQELTVHASRVVAGTLTSPTAASVIEVNDAADPLNGLRVDLPAGTFNEPREVRILEIVGAALTLWPGLTPSTPVFRIETGELDPKRVVSRPLSLRMPNGALPSDSSLAALLFSQGGPSAGYGENAADISMPVGVRMEPNVTGPDWNFSDMSLGDKFLAAGFGQILIHDGLPNFTFYAPAPATNKARRALVAELEQLAGDFEQARAYAATMSCPSLPAKKVPVYFQPLGAMGVFREEQTAIAINSDTAWAEYRPFVAAHELFHLLQHLIQRSHPNAATFRAFRPLWAEEASAEGFATNVEPTIGLELQYGWAQDWIEAYFPKKLIHHDDHYRAGIFFYQLRHRKQLDYCALWNAALDDMAGFQSVEADDRTFFRALIDLLGFEAFVEEQQAFAYAMLMTRDDQIIPGASNAPIRASVPVLQLPDVLDKSGVPFKIALDGSKARILRGNVPLIDDQLVLTIDSAPEQFGPAALRDFLETHWRIFDPRRPTLAGFDVATGAYEIAPSYLKPKAIFPTVELSRDVGVLFSNTYVSEKHTGAEYHRILDLVLRPPLATVKGALTYGAGLPVANKQIRVFYERMPADDFDVFDTDAEGKFEAQVFAGRGAVYLRASCDDSPVDPLDRDRAGNFKYDIDAPYEGLVVDIGTAQHTDCRIFNYGAVGPCYSEFSATNWPGTFESLCYYYDDPGGVGTVQGTLDDIYQRALEVYGIPGGEMFFAEDIGSDFVRRHFHPGPEFVSPMNYKAGEATFYGGGVSYPGTVIAASPTAACDGWKELWEAVPWHVSNNYGTFRLQFREIEYDEVYGYARCVYDRIRQEDSAVFREATLLIHRCPYWPFYAGQRAYTGGHFLCRRSRLIRVQGTR